MMMSEFIERTGYEPSYDEYQLIVESYYDFDGDKNAFCKQWKKDLKNGTWAKELMLRRAIVDLRNMYEAKIEEVESDKNFYRDYFYQTQALQNENNALKAKLEAIKDLLK